MMTKIKLVKVDDPILRKKCTRVGEIDWDLQNIAHDMMDYCYVVGGLGLAAPQVGINKAFFVTEYKLVVNPKILAKSGCTQGLQESCLSLPGISVFVNRPIWIEVEYEDDLKGHNEETLWNLEARIFLHEYDHLQGKLITDYL